jgi:hypothetical protein
LIVLLLPHCTTAEKASRSQVPAVNASEIEDIEKIRFAMDDIGAESESMREVFR